MELQILNKNVELTKETEQSITKKLDHLDRISSHIMNGELVLEEERGRINGELILNVKGKKLTARAVEKDAITVITTLRSKMQSQLKTYEGKMKHPR
jgi:ribosomal subunit interface protein